MILCVSDGGIQGKDKKMKKTEALEKLFDQWSAAHKFEVFCKDGIVDEKTYNEQELNVLLILKDVNNAKPGEEVDLRKSLVTRTDEGRTWFNAARWCSGLLGEKYDKTKYMDSLKQHEVMKRVAVINLKKEAGGARASDECILTYSKNDAEQIRKEIEICNPDLVITCGRVVFECLKNIIYEFKPDEGNLYGKVVFDGKMNKYGNYFDISKFLHKEKPVYIVEYRHPNQATLQGTLAEHYENMLKIRDFVLDKQ